MSNEALILLKKQYNDNCEAITYLKKIAQNNLTAVAALERDNAVIAEKYREVENAR